MTYTLQYVNGSSLTQIAGISGVSRAVSSLAKGQTYLFSVRADNDAFSGPFTSTMSAIPLGLIPPLCVSV